MEACDDLEGNEYSIARACCAAFGTPLTHSCGCPVQCAVCSVATKRWAMGKKGVLMLSRALGAPNRNLPSHLGLKVPI